MPTVKQNSQMARLYIFTSFPFLLFDFNYGIVLIVPVSKH